VALKLQFFDSANEKHAHITLCFVSILPYLSASVFVMWKAESADVINFGTFCFSVICVEEVVYSSI